MASDLLTTMRAEIDTRLSELRPLVSEYERLLAAVDALADAGGEPSRLGPSASGPSVTSPRPGAASPESSAMVSDSASPFPSFPSPRRGRPRGSAAGAFRRAASSPTPAEGPEDEMSGDTAASPKQERAARGAAQQAIVAALEHGSHTVGELVVVTAMTGANIRGNLRRLLKERTVTRTKREGKAAYALSSPPASD
ncbi:MAG TPA: hypothetical protein VGG98_05420 [Solirubrobacteraceae bacterium]|jgi:hypothetical protein